MLALGLWTGGGASAAEPKREAGRKPPASLASLPPPAAASTRSILLVDDDASSNNVGGSSGAVQQSDEVFGALAAAAAGERGRWTRVVVKSDADGPTFEQLQPHSLVLWYTGASYGRGTDTISPTDEKVIRRYLEEVGGAVILISPGYVNNLVYGQSWASADHPFLKEVLGVNGCYGLAQRSSPGTVRAHTGASFTVAHPGAADAQFSVVNSDGAALVFTSALRPGYVDTTGELPVAVANPYGRGRIVYVGFTFENIPEPARSAAFGVVLGAATGQGGDGPVALAPGGGRAVRVTPAPPAVSAPAPAPLPSQPALPVPQPVLLTVMHAGWRRVEWDYPTGHRVEAYEVHRRDNGQWVRVGRVTQSVSPGKFSFDDRAFCTPDNAYKIVARHHDNRTAESAVSVNPFPVQPGKAEPLGAVQSGANEITVTWDAAVDGVANPQLGHGYHRYLVHGPGLPTEGRFVDPPIVRDWFRTSPTAPLKYGPITGSEKRRVVLANVPLGRHEIRVIKDYGEGATRLLSPQVATATVTVTAWRGPVTGGGAVALLPGTGGQATASGPAPSGAVIVPTRSEPTPGAGGPQTVRTFAPGPAPKNLTVQPLSGGARGYWFSWQTVGDRQSRALYRKDGDRWIFMVGDRDPASVVWNTAPTWEDGFEINDPWIIPGTVFKVEIRYADGRVGEAELTYADPPRPVMPVVTNLRAVQTGHRRLRLSWTRPPPLNARANEAVNVSSPGFPGGAQKSEVSEGVAEQWMDIHNVPEGRHTFTIGQQEIWGKPVAGAAHTTIEIAPISHRARVVLLGFRVGRKTTDDDVFDGDGRGDEVYFTAYRASVAISGDGVGIAPLGFVESVVIGDTGRFPSRQRGGAAGPTGGIRSGDAVPSAAALALQPGIAADRDRLPMLLWEGVLDRGHWATIVALSGWEWDVAPAVQVQPWTEFWTRSSTQSVLRFVAGEAAVGQSLDVLYQPLAAVELLDRFAVSSSRGGTRPLGGLRAGPLTWECVPHGIALTLANLEKLLGQQSAALVEAPLGQYRSPSVDEVEKGERDESEYTAILQIERLPMRPEEIGRPGGPWVVEVQKATTLEGPRDPRGPLWKTRLGERRLGR